MENSRATKFLLARGAKVIAVLTSTNYCVSPLVQGGLEIPCRVEISMPPTVKNKKIIEIYKEMVDFLYYERETTMTVGTFLVTEDEETHPLPTQPKFKKKKPKAKVKDSQIVSTEKDIRLFFKKRVVESTQREPIHDKDDVVELSD